MGTTSPSAMSTPGNRKLGKWVWGRTNNWGTADSSASRHGHSCHAVVLPCSPRHKPATASQRKCFRRSAPSTRLMPELPASQSESAPFAISCKSRSRDPDCARASLSKTPFSAAKSAGRTGRMLSSFVCAGLRVLSMASSRSGCVMAFRTSRKYLAAREPKWFSQGTRRRTLIVRGFTGARAFIHGSDLRSSDRDTPMDVALTRRELRTRYRWPKRGRLGYW
jgi:hypothetical protein